MVLKPCLMCTRWPFINGQNVRDEGARPYYFGKFKIKRSYLTKKFFETSSNNTPFQKRIWPNKMKSLLKLLTDLSVDKI